MVRHILAWLTILAAAILTTGTAQAEDALSASDWAPDRTADQESGAVAPEAPVEASPAAISDSDAPKDPSAPEDTKAPSPLAPQDETPIDVDAIHLDRHYLTIESLPDRDQVPMTLLDCVRTALHANQDIQVAAYNPLKAEADAFASLGEFDPLLKGSALYTRSAQSTGSDVRTYTGGVASIDAYRTSSNATLNGKLPWGTQYQASFDLGHEETTFNSFFSEYSGGMTLSLSQPLLRGRGSDYNLTRIRIAKNATQAAEDALRIQVMTSVADVIKAYWDLAGARQNVVVRRESLANAERLLDINKKRFDIGIGSSLEVVQAQAGIATRQSDYIAAISQVRDAEDRLKDLLNAERTPLLWPAEIVPVDEPSLHDIALDGEMSVKAALENRPEVH
ncbi:MAG TPA: TolC family protein, partial [Candidatus Hydrogenedentes bacterium]|nr:TolC family protein [Candidatus Hydrogenedentota bacterium]